MNLNTIPVNNAQTPVHQSKEWRFPTERYFQTNLLAKASRNNVSWLATVMISLSRKRYGAFKFPKLKATWFNCHAGNFMSDEAE